MPNHPDTAEPQPSTLIECGHEPPVPSPAEVALFLDLDGTLADLQPDPGLVSVPAAALDALARLELALDGALAIVSGRPGIDLDRLTHPLHLPYAAGHGAERRDRHGVVVQAPAPPSLDAARAELRRQVTHWPGVWIEPKSHGLAVHYRAAPGMATRVEVLVRAIAERHAPEFDVQPGKMVFELRPHGIHKGAALRAFMRDAPFSGRIPIAVGDDLTDESAFIAAQQAGGYGVKVGAGPSTAVWRFRDPSALTDWLVRLGKQAP